MAVDVSELITSFSRLTIVDSADDDHLTRHTDHLWPSLTPLGFITPCVRAPMPALVGRVSPVACYSTKTGGSNTRATPTMLPPSNPTSRRPRRGLPRRLPKGCPRDSFQCTTRVASSPAQIHSPATSRSLSRSSSSSGSDLDSPLSTPPMLGATLPVDSLPSVVLTTDDIINADSLALLSSHFESLSRQRCVTPNGTDIHTYPLISDIFAPLLSVTP